MNSLTKFWYVIVILVLAIAVLIYRQSLIQAKLDIEQADTIAKIQKKMDAIDGGLADMKKREELLYPDLKLAIKNLENQKKDYLKRKTEIQKEQTATRDKINKMNLVDVSTEFASMGYNNEIKEK